MPLLRSLPSARNKTLAAVEVAVDPHHHASPSTGTSEAHQGQVKAGNSKVKNAAKKRWATMSKASKEVLLDKMYKARYGKKRPNRSAKPQYKKSADTKAKQHIYAARHAARKAGLPVPPLPSQEQGLQGKMQGGGSH